MAYNGMRRDGGAHTRGGDRAGAMRARRRGTLCLWPVLALRAVFGRWRLVELLLAGDALEVRRNTGAAAAVVLRYIGEYAKRSRHLDCGRCVVDEFGGNDRVRRIVFLDPVHERGECVERIGTGAARAMVHPRHHEQ